MVRMLLPLALHDDIAPNDFRRDTTRCAHIICLRPQVLLPTHPLEVRKTFSQIPRTVAFEQVGNLHRRKAWQRGHKNVYMVLVRFQREQR